MDLTDVGLRKLTTDQTTDTGAQWYAIEAATRKEAQIASVLSQKGYECFLPLCKVRRMWSDRIKVIESPLFSGYVFSRFDPRARLPILVTPGVRNIVSVGGICAAIPDREIEALRIAVQNGLQMEPWDGLEQGDRVRVIRGPLAGVEGTFVRHRGRDRLVLRVSLIHQAVAVEVDSFCVQVLRRKPSVRHQLTMANAGAHSY